MSQHELDFWKDVAIIFGGVLALASSLFGILEFVRQGRQHRAANFVQMRRRFLEDPLFREILNLLATNSPELSSTPIQDRRNFVGFLEEVALMVNSGLIRKEVAHYMFGYYVLTTASCENFWVGLDPKSQYWSVFRQFSELMKTLNKDQAQALPDLRF